MASRIISAIRRRVQRHCGTSRPLGGYAEHRHGIAFVDPLSDEDLAELNKLLPWKAFTVDRHGRRFGGVAWTGKRDRPQEVPDRRVLLLDARFRLANKHVLEIGCFEGIHTVALSKLAHQVTAVDGRIENVVKTLVRAGLYGYQPRVFQHDVEQREANYDLLGADVLHHVGVLYHLKDPVRHLLEIGRYIGLGVMLDTHYALPEEASLTYVVDGREFPYKLFHERGRRDVFSGLHPHSKWLPLDVIESLLRESGFGEVEVVETRRERNGPRVLLFGRRTPEESVRPAHL
ncbi:MAG: class I SAM-dependent methyltransferase [Gemmatimonadales bacterium]